MNEQQKKRKMSCCFCVSHKTASIVEALGKFDYIAGPGCHCICPCYQTVRGPLSLRICAIPIKVDSKTSDNALIQVAATVLYRIIPERVRDAFYKFTSPEIQIRSFAANVIRGQVPKHTVDEVFLLRDEMQKALKGELEEQMAGFGYEIVATLITDIDPSKDIKHAMSQINTNARLRVAVGYEAETEKIKIVKAAEADAEAKRLSGVGLAEQRKATILGLQSSVANFAEHAEGMSSKDIMSLLMMNQYFDAVKDIALHGKGSVVFLPGQRSSSMDVAEGVMAAAAGKKA